MSRYLQCYDNYDNLVYFGPELIVSYRDPGPLEEKGCPGTTTGGLVRRFRTTLHPPITSVEGTDPGLNPSLTEVMTRVSSVEKRGSLGFLSFITEPNYLTEFPKLTIVNFQVKIKNLKKINFRIILNCHPLRSY